MAIKFKPRIFAVLTVALAAGIVGCSSGSNSGNSGSSPSAGSSGSSATNTPYKLGAIVDLSGTNGAFTDFLDAYKAGVAQVNAQGGVNGHQLQLDVCDSQTDPNATAACGRKMASDKVFMVVGTTYSGNYAPYLQAAGIPFTTSINDPILLSNPYSMPNYSGGLSGLPALAAVAGQSGCKNVVLIDAASNNTPAGEQGIEKQFVAVAKTVGIKGEAIFVQSGQADYAPAIGSAVSDGADCVATNALGADEVGLIKGAVQSSTKLQVFTAEYALDPPTQKSLGATILGEIHAIDTGRQATGTSPQVKAAVAALTKYAPQPYSLAATSLLNVAAVDLAAYAASHVSSVTAANVYHYLSTLTSYSDGLTPPINFAKAPANPLGNRMLVPYAIKVKYMKGQFYDDGPFVNAFTGASVPG